MRKETDSLGEVLIPDDALYGINTARAMENFNIPFRSINPDLIKAIILIKKAAARTYIKLNTGDAQIWRAIEDACDEFLEQEHPECFSVCALQGGAGTSANMSVNEAIANLALKKLGFPPGRYDIIHPLDHVNRGQSTNDVCPTALRIAAIGKLRSLSDECAALQSELQLKENEWADIKKLGRTELMDAVPVTLGEEFGSYAQAIARDRWRLYKVEERLRLVNMGGSAVGIATGKDKKYRAFMLEELRLLTGFGLAAAEYPMDLTQNNDVFVEVSGLLKALAVNLIKISNDIRLMGSGPHGGLGELRLEPLQQGSTIMAGKVNPVIPEMTIQCAIKVTGNDTCITMAAAHGEFELNAFFPLIADCLLESLELMCGAVCAFREKCIRTAKPGKEACERHLAASAAFAAEYVPVLGYDTVSKVIKNNSPDAAREILCQLQAEIHKK